MGMMIRNDQKMLQILKKYPSYKPFTRLQLAIGFINSLGIGGAALKYRA